MFKKAAFGKIVMSEVFLELLNKHHFMPTFSSHLRLTSLTYKQFEILFLVQMLLWTILYFL